MVGRFTRNDRELYELRGKTVRVVGLTGGIASGKTIATDALKTAGFTIVDADEISRALTAAGTPAEKEICKMFQDASRRGKLDRRALRDMIAADGTKRRELEEFTHPLIIAEIQSALGGDGQKVLVAPLLFETALARLCDCTVCVICPMAIRIERIINRDGVSRNEAKRIIDAQIPDLYRATLADFCVPSDMGKDEFEEEIVDLFTKIMHSACA